MHLHDRIAKKMKTFGARVEKLQEEEQYFFNQTVENLGTSAWVRVGNRDMMMFASYSYLGLIEHPKIRSAAQQAIEKYGTGTHGVRMLAGTLPIHKSLEKTIAEFKGTEDAVTYSSGYVTNLTAISMLAGRGDHIFCDRLNHTSIVDGCLLSGAHVHRYRHNDLDHLEQAIRKADPHSTKLVVADAVFSMDGDIADLPRLSELCRRHKAWLMIDEAHSLGVLGKTGRGIEEHFGMEQAVDIKMGTLSKTIPAAGGYLAGKRELIDLFRHASHGFIFSAALTPPQAAAAQAALQVILEEPQRVERLRENTGRFLAGLRQRGFDIMRSETAIAPVICGSDEKAYRMTSLCQQDGVFVLPVVSPAVPAGQARLRATVTAAHTAGEIDAAMAVFERAGRKLGIIK